MEKHTEEYLFLKDEIIRDGNSVHQYRNLMYTTTAAIFAFSFTQLEPLIFMLPVTMIMPIFKICMGRYSAMCRIGAYLYVFLEGDIFKWETRLHEYDFYYSKSVKKSIISPYSLSIISCFLLFLYKFDYMNILLIENLIRIIVSCLITIICIIIIYIKQIDYIKLKNKYIKRWEHVKEKEIIIDKL